MLAIFIFILIITLIVVVHEWGHYVMAKKNGVLVHEFAVGMGPKIWSVKRGETLYSLRVFPIGGFCSMQEEVGDSDNPRSMCSKKPWQKLLIISFGAIMNFVFAWLLLTILASSNGYSSNVIKTLEANMPVQEANLVIGDEIIAVDGVRVKKLSDITKLVENKEKSYIFTILRAEQEPFNVELKQKWLEAEQTARFGFTSEKIHFNIIENIKIGFIQTFNVIRLVWSGLIQLVTGQVPMDQVAGIVGVADFSAKQWDTGMRSGGILKAIESMIFLAAIISANLGVVNLLPIPALDGSRIVFILIEILRGKPLAPEKESIIHAVGFVLLMLLTVVILYNDLVKVFSV